MTAATARAGREDALAALLLAAFGCAVACRWALSGPAGPASVPAGLVFAGCLAALATAAGVSAPGRLVPGVAGGMIGALVLIVPVLLRFDPVSAGGRPVNGLLPWLAATATVAVCEEAFLRGALFSVVAQAHTETTAVLVAAVAFAAMHVPLYGWHVVPLDLAVGMLLGTLRAVTGTWAAPAVAHVVADAAGWWLV